MILFTCGIVTKSNKGTNKTNQNKLIDTDNGMVVTKGKGGGQSG